MRSRIKRGTWVTEQAAAATPSISEAFGILSASIMADPTLSDDAKVAARDTLMKAKKKILTGANGDGEDAQAGAGDSAGFVESHGRRPRRMADLVRLESRVVALESASGVVGGVPLLARGATREQ